MEKTGNENIAPLIRIVDDDKMMRRSWLFMLKAAGYNVVAYEDAVQFLEQDDSSLPGCLLLDVRMPKMSGLELQEIMDVRGIELPIVFITGHGEVDMAVFAFKHGAIDFLQKPVDEKRLLEALKEAISKDLVRRSQQKAVLSTEKRYASLTPREKEVVKYVAKGLMNKVIASKLGISERTVQIHRGVACRKLGVRSGVELLLVLQSIGEAPD
jgi:FixJ family two-component response regulator